MTHTTHFRRLGLIALLAKVILRSSLMVAGGWLLTLGAEAQTLTITNGVQIYGSLINTTVTLSNRCELRITDTNSPISGSLINLNSADSFFVMQNIRPSVVAATYLAQVRVSGAAAVADSNCRVVQYG